MKPAGLIILFCFLQVSLRAQYFFTGEVRDGHGDKLINGSILIHSTGSSYRPGSYGEFGIISRVSEDSLTLMFEGYEPYTTVVRANEFLQITLKSHDFPADTGENSLRSAWKGARFNIPATGSAGGPNNIIENPFVGQAASLSFNCNSSRTSYDIIKRFLNMGYVVPADAVQIEGMLNYFNFYYEEPEEGNTFQCSSKMLVCPWNDLHKLLCLSICARKVDLQNTPPANLVLLIDASGSMDLPDKLPVIKSGIRLLINNLRDIDTVSVVTFGGQTRILLEAVPGTEKRRIMKAIEGITPDGPTPGQDGIRLAYEVAGEQFIPGGNNRVVLVTDGDITAQGPAEEALEELVGQQSQGGILLSCIGVGMNNDKDSRLPLLAQRGHGDFAYAANEQDAENILAEQLAKKSFSVADSVVVSIDFNPALVKEYRLIGYDNKRSLSEDSTFRLVGSKISSGHSLLALFELIPVEKAKNIDSIAEVKINYCLPGQHAGKLLSYHCTNNLTTFDRGGPGLEKAACIALFGMKLRESGYVAQTTWSDMEKMAKKNFSGNDRTDKEFMELIARAKKIYRRDK